MSDALTDIARAEKEKFEYLAAVSTISKYIITLATRRPSGPIRDKYLELAYSDVARAIKNEVEESLELMEEK